MANGDRYLGLLQGGMKDRQVIEALGCNPVSREPIPKGLIGGNEDEAWMYDFYEGYLSLYFEKGRLTSYTFTEKHY